MGWRPDLQEEVHSQQPDGTAAGSWLQEACLEVLPDEDRPLPHRAVSTLDEGSVLVVPAQDADTGAPLQGVS